MSSFVEALNPFTPFKETTRFIQGKQGVGQTLMGVDAIGGTFKRQSEEHAKQKQQVKENEDRQAREAREFQSRLQGQRDTANRELSESQRSTRRGIRGRRRSLLTGDERGVDTQGKRVITG